MQDLQQGIAPDPLLELLGRELSLEAVIQKGPRLRIQDIPHLRLSVLPLMLKSIGIIGMHLDRQILLRINELRQDRKIFKSPAAVSEKLLPLFPDILRERLSLIFSACYDGRPVRVAAQNPGFGADRTAVIHMIFLHQPMPSPEIILYRGLQL